MLVVVESPYAGNVGLNETYARACLRFVLDEGHAPYASHLLYTQPGVLRDGVPAEREKGINAGFEWGAFGDERWVFLDRGVGDGMIRGIQQALDLHQQLRFYERWTRLEGVVWSFDRRRLVAE